MAASEPLIRPPQQRRSQESLERLLEAGFEVLQERGCDGFTLHEVSRRAGVSIGSIYARVPSREALIMAIYERAMSWTAGADTERLQIRLAAEANTQREHIEAVVKAEVMTMLDHADTLRVFMREAGRWPEIFERGSAKSKENARVFKAGILAVWDPVDHRDPELAVDIAWRMIFSTVSRRITHGPHFESSHPVSDEQLTEELAHATADYLL